MGDILDSIGSFISDTIGSAIQWILYNTIYWLLYWISVAFCWIVDVFYTVFEVFGGLVKVRYNEDSDYLINVFFSNSAISNIYWGMALIGIAMAFGFMIVSVARKMFDGQQKQQHSMGNILANGAKSILIIISLSAIMTIVLNSTNLLMQQIDYLFDNADSIDKAESIEFTDEEFATMARVLNTVGNYSLNPSSSSRYNLNSCYNALRPDLDYLCDQGVFDFSYITKDAKGETIVTWQSALQKLVNAHNTKRELKMDVYYDGTNKAILEIMEEMQTNAAFVPLEKYVRPYKAQTDVDMDVQLFLMSSMRAAKNSSYNEKPTMTDPIRGPYFIGEKSIYDFDTVEEDFDIAITAFDYIVLFIAGVIMIRELLAIIMVCIVRIFNMLLLYLVAPPILATMALDDGGKFKQWMIAFIVQCMGVFATVISMRIFVLLLPMIISTELILFDNMILNVIGKLLIIIGALEAVRRANAMIAGILADSAGWQSINAGDVGGMGRGFASTLGGGALGIAKGVGGVAAAVGGSFFKAPTGDPGYEPDDDDDGGGGGGSLPGSNLGTGEKDPGGDGKDLPPGDRSAYNGAFIGSDPDVDSYLASKDGGGGGKDGGGNLSAGDRSSYAGAFIGGEGGGGGSGGPDLPGSSGGFGAAPAPAPAPAPSGGPAPPAPSLKEAPPPRVSR